MVRLVDYLAIEHSTPVAMSLVMTALLAILALMFAAFRRVLIPAPRALARAAVVPAGS